MTKKQDKLLADMRKELADFKKINAENKEMNQLLKDQINEYEQLTKSFVKSVPKGMFN